MSNVEHGVVRNTGPGAVIADGTVAPHTLTADLALRVTPVGTPSAALSEQVDDAKFTPATSYVTMLGATFDDVATDSVDEGDGGAVRMTADRILFVTYPPASTSRFGPMQDDVDTFAPGKNYAQPVGGLVDDTATDSADEGDFAAIRLTARRAQAASLDTLLAGENQTLNVMRFSKDAQFVNITTATTTTVKSGAGIVEAIVWLKRVATGVTTIYDNTSAAGTKLGTCTVGAAVLNDPPQVADIGAAFSTGLTIVTSAAEDILVVYR